MASSWKGSSANGYRARNSSKRTPASSDSGGPGGEKAEGRGRKAVDELLLSPWSSPGALAFCFVSAEPDFEFWALGAGLLASDRGLRVRDFVLGTLDFGSWSGVARLRL